MSEVSGNIRAERVELRKFDSGATRSGDSYRDDPEGYLSPLVIDRYSEYMTKHRIQVDGKTRDSDNWQKGMPLASYMKGLWRHFLHLWTRHRGFPVRDPGAAVNIEEDLCAMMFNLQGYLHETIKARLKKEGSTPVDLKGCTNCGQSPQYHEDTGKCHPLLAKCPENLLPDGPRCPRCGGNRAPSGVDGGSWVHFDGGAGRAQDSGTRG